MKLGFAALSGVAALFVGALGAAAPAQAVEINALFASTYSCSICGVANVVSLQGNASVQAAITAATQQIASQFGDNLTTNILFYGVHGGTTGNEAFLGASISGQTVYTFNQYSTALAADAAAHPQNTVLNSGAANLTNGNGAGHPLVVVNTTDARLLGLNAGVPVSPLFGAGDSTAQFSATGSFVGGGGVADAIVYLNLDQPFDYSRPIPGFSNPTGAIYDAESTMEHEINEVMGIGGAGSQLNDFNFDANYAHDFYGVHGPLMGVMDLYRYQAPGVGSFDPTHAELTGCPAGFGFAPPACNGSPSPYFSVDGGVTSIDTFNQIFPEIGGDAGDWGLSLSGLCPGGGGLGGTGDVQDAFSCNNRSPDVMAGTPSYKAFQSIGYNAVPEPAGWALMIAGFGLMGATLRRRSRAAATA
jgi:hypothetical protein